MKTLNKIWGISLLALLLIVAAPRKSMAQDISEQDFYDSLQPYGTWVSDPQYGDVWVPDAEDGFRPYASRGHWVLHENMEIPGFPAYPWGWQRFPLWHAGGMMIITAGNGYPAINGPRHG